MTIKTFWKILIKVLGIWLILSSLSVISQFLSFIQYFGSSSHDNNGGLAIGITIIFLTLFLFFMIIRLFIFKPDWLINKLQLEKGFDEDRIDLNIKHSTVLNIAIIVVGALIFVESFPQLCRQIFVLVQQKQLFRESENSGWIIFHAIKTIMGYLLMTNSQLVLKFINKEKKSDN